jgi:drug/metabolite transporter (DMT)-like permease
LADAPRGARRGDLLMVAAACCMALYSVWSKPFIRRLGPIPFTALAMAAGAACLGAISWAEGGLGALAMLEPGQWVAVLYLGIVGGGLAFWLWAFALQRTTPTRVAVSVTVNPIAAALVGALLLDEPLHWNLAIGLVLVMAGIWLAGSGPASAPAAGRALRLQA